MQIQNPDATEVIRNQAKLTIGDGWPSNLLPNVQPVMDMSPRFHRNINFFVSNTRNTSGSTTSSTPADGDTFIVGCMLSVAKDATCDVATGTVAALQVQVSGVAQVILRIAGLTLTAERDSVVLMFDRPIKVDRNSTIGLSTSTYSAGLMNRSFAIYGYTVQ